MALLRMATTSRATTGLATTGEGGGGQWMPLHCAGGGQWTPLHCAASAHLKQQSPLRNHWASQLQQAVLHPTQVKIFMQTRPSCAEVSAPAGLLHSRALCDAMCCCCCCCRWGYAADGYDRAGFNAAGIDKHGLARFDLWAPTTKCDSNASLGTQVRHSTLITLITLILTPVSP
jgi:hypothetical protein